MNKLNLFIYINTLFTPIIFDLNPLQATPPCHHHQFESSLRTIHPSLKGLVAKLREFPDSNRIIENALQQGSITVDIAYKGMPFEAMWEGELRKISIDGNSNNTEGRILCHILFEMMNAVSEPKYKELYQMAEQGRIDCDSYVEIIERIEHNNMIQTANIIEKGITAGVFPSSARWSFIYDFATHYKIQQLVGHSILIAKEYQDITGQAPSCYQGTVKNLKNMSKTEKTSLAGSLHSYYFRSQWERGV
ncbi:MAG: hypothetical protein WD595_00680 [Waddliaceae bacterium]